MYHSITFGDKNTWTDWHLVPSSRPVVNPPKLKSLFVDIPGGDGLEDLTEIVSGCPTYSNREGSWEFLVMNGYQDWDCLYSDIMDYLHGQYMKVILEDDPAFYYEGRLTVNQWKSDKYWSKIVIDYNLKPYKLLKYSSAEEWKWDDIDFEHNIDLVSTQNIRVDLIWSVRFNSLRKTITPVFTVSSDDGNGMTVGIANAIDNTYKSVHFADGPSQTHPDLQIKGPGVTTIYVSESGNITIDFRMGRL